MTRWVLVLGLGLVGCDESPAEADAACADAPVLTWDNFGGGFLIENCQACHASPSVERQGAPSDVSFDTEAEAWAWADRILARATGDAPDMPPQGGVSADDRVRLAFWLECGG